MTKGLKALVGVVLVFSLLISGVGYASLTDTLSVTGTASAEAPEGVIIYDVQFTENNLGTFNNVTYPSGTVLMADSVTFDANGQASIFVYVRNNSAKDMMYYGINTSPAENPGYTAQILDPNSVETGNSLDTTGRQYIVGVKGKKSEHISAVDGAVIGSGTSHDGLLLALAGSPNTTINNLALSLEYGEIEANQHWRGYYITFKDGTTPIQVNGLDSQSDNVEPFADGTGMLVNTVDADGTKHENTIDLSSFTPTSPGNGKVFSGTWLNGFGVAVDHIESNNVNDYVLYPSWDSVYTIYFFDDQGNIFHSQTLTAGRNEDLTDETKQIIAAKLKEINDNTSNPDIVAEWSSYDVDNEVDQFVRPQWEYVGKATLTPRDENGDGVVDEYWITGVEDQTNVNIQIPSDVNGIPVTQIGNGSFSEFHKVEDIFIPKSITYIGADAFADEETNYILGFIPSGLKYETIQFYYEGTIADWIALEKDENWDRYLGTSSFISCRDGTIRMTSHGENKANRNWDAYTAVIETWDQFQGVDNWTTYWNEHGWGNLHETQPD